MKTLLVIALLSVGCGAEQLPAGVFDVEATYSTNDFALMELDYPDKPPERWTIRKSDNGGYILNTVWGGEDLVEGQTYGNGIHFYRQTSFLPCGANSFRAVISHEGDGTYSGHVQTWIGFCADTGLLQEGEITLTLTHHEET